MRDSHRPELFGHVVSTPTVLSYSCCHAQLPVDVSLAMNLVLSIYIDAQRDMLISNPQTNWTKSKLRWIEYNLISVDLPSSVELSRTGHAGRSIRQRGTVADASLPSSDGRTSSSSSPAAKHSYCPTIYDQQALDAAKRSAHSASLDRGTPMDTPVNTPRSTTTRIYFFHFYFDNAAIRPIIGFI